MGLQEDEIGKAPLDQLIRWWSEAVPDSVESRVRFRISVAKALIRRQQGIAFLKDQLHSEDLEKRYRALRDLTRKEVVDQEIIDGVLEAFESSEPILKFCALSCLRGLKHYALNPASVEALLFRTELLDGEVASEAMSYLAQANPDTASAIVEAGLRSNNRNVRAKACDCAWENHLYDLLPELERLETDPDWFVANEARTAVEMLHLIKRNRHT